MKNKARIKSELKGICSELLLPYRDLSYEVLRDAVIFEEPDIHMGSLSDGAEYQAEIEVFWDDKPDDVIRVCCMADPSPHPMLFGFIPIYISSIGDSFLMRPDGSFEDEECA